jgi:hypothetical protein
MEKLRISVDDKGKIEIWMDGCIVKGVRGIELYWEVGEIPYHKIEFATQAAKFDRKYSVE